EAAVLAIAVRLEVGQRLRVVGRPGPGAAKRCERIEGDDPRRNGGCEVLREERAERLVLPGLDVARRPVVEQAQPEDMRLGVVERDRLALAVAAADPDAALELVVEATTFGEHRRGGARRHHLAARPGKGLAAYA